MKTFITVMLTLFLTYTSVFANDLDLSIIHNLDKDRMDFAMAVQMDLVPSEVIDIEMAYYLALNVAYANEEEERYEAHAAVLEELYEEASDAVNRALDFTAPEADKGI